uniref:Uncharacterized protein n=1 Tax=viral metagenome TaxID=1070528 RepID=A0A6C0JTF9_9ZZZZ
MESVNTTTLTVSFKEFITDLSNTRKINIKELQFLIDMPHIEVVKYITENIEGKEEKDIKVMNIGNIYTKSSKNTKDAITKHLKKLIELSKKEIEIQNTEIEVLTQAPIINNLLSGIDLGSIMMMVNRPEFSVLMEKTFEKVKKSSEGKPDIKKIIKDFTEVLTESNELDFLFDEVNKMFIK